jgi:cytochrome c biogenesis protein CcdA
VLDARLGGLAAAAIAVACRAPVLVTVIAAAATTAAIRLLAG